MSELLIPGQIIKLQSPFPTERPWFNPGLCRWNGRLTTLARLDRFPSKMILSILDDETLQPIENRLPLEMGNNCIPEDARMVAMRKGTVAIYFVGVQLREHVNAVLKMDVGHTMWHTVLSHDGSIDVPEKLPFGDGVREKNWVPLYDHGRIFLVYSHAPWTVITRTGSGQYAKIGFSGGQPPHVEWDYGEIRGGTPPVYHAGRWYEFFHSCRHEYASDGCKVRVYYVGCMTIDDDLRPLSITRQPIMGGSAENFEHPWHNGGAISAVFPCGCVCENDEFLISYGYLDKECRIARIPVAEIDERLEPMP